LSRLLLLCFGAAGGLAAGAVANAVVTEPNKFGPAPGVFFARIGRGFLDTDLINEVFANRADRCVGEAGPLDIIMLGQSEYLLRS
jgi:hypothetical protein